MATSSTFYLDAPSLSSASVVFSNAALTVVAADGFYSDGSIVREQLSGVLLPQQICPACSIPCGGTISASGGQGIYYLTTELGQDVGAVVIRFDPLNVPDGIVATYDSINYNGVSSLNFGWLQGSSGLATYIGQISSDCGIVASSPLTLSEFEYNGTTFAPLGTTTIVTILAGQMQLTASAPGNTVMVIPKTQETPSILDLSFIGPCSGTVFNISVACPAALPSFAASTVHVSSALACDDTIDQTYYVAFVNGGTGVLGLYDLVFTDPNGEFKLGEGFYKTTDAGGDDWFQVDTNGIVIAIGVCVVPPVESYNCVSGNCVDPGDGTGIYSTLGACEAACFPITFNCVNGNCVDPGDGTGTFATLGACEAVCGSPTVVSVFGYMEPCGGITDDYMGAAVALDFPVDVDTQFVVDVFYVDAGGTCAGTQFTETFNVSILAGNDLSNFDACTQGTFFPSGATICSACITAVDNPSVDISSFGCTIPLPVTGLTWDLTVNNPCDATPWTISNQNLKIRYDITDSFNCGGTCNSIQAGTATATITVGAIDVNMGLSFEGVGELEQSNFEKITFSLDGSQVASANAAGGGLGCQMGPVVQTFTTAPPYFLLANSVHTLLINFTTNDALFHVGSFYEVDLTFVEVP